MSQRLTGAVKWFDRQKGFGMIVADGGAGQSYYVHYSDVVRKGLRMLAPGERVTFEVDPRHDDDMRIAIKVIPASAGK